MHTFPRRRHFAHTPFSLLACCLLSILHAPPARATDFNFDGGAGTLLWADSANWLPNGVPGLTDALLLTNASLPGPQTIDLAGNQRIDHIFTNGVNGLYTLTNSNPSAFLEIFGPADSSVILTQNPAGALTFDTNVSFASAARFFVNSDPDGGKISFSAGRTLSTTASSGTTTLNLTSRNTSLDYAIEVHSLIADAPGARMALEAGYANDADAHVARVLVTAANTYTGPTSVNGATLAFTSIADIGAGATALGNPTTLADATINLGTNLAAPNNVPGTLRYVGTDPAGHSSNRPFQFTGFSPGGTIESSGAGPLTLSGGLTSTSSSSVSRTLTLAGTNTASNTFSGVIADVPGTALQHLAKSGPGTWTLAAPNTYLGTTTVNDGILIVATGGAIGAAGTAGRILATNNADLRLAGGTITSTELDVFNDALLDFRSGTLNLTGPAGSALYGRATPQIGTLGTGTLNLAAFTEANALIVHGPDDTLNLAPGATLSTIALHNSAGGTVSLPAGSTLTLIDPNFGFTTGPGSVAGAITGPGNLTKVGPGTFTVSSPLAYTGDTTVSQGTLRLTSSGRLHDLSDLLVNAPGTFESDAAPDAIFSLNGDGTVNLLNNAGFVVGNFDNPGGTGTFTGLIQGDGTLAKRGTGTLTLTANNTYTGQTFIQEGTLTIHSIADIGVASALGAPGTVANATIEIGSTGELPTLRYAGTDPAGHSSNRPIHLPAASAILDASGAGPLLLSGPLTTAGTTSRTLFLTGSNTADNTYAGVIPLMAGSPTLGLTKSGAGRWVLTAPNTYDGTTTVSSGELVVRGPSGAINTPGSIDVNTSATLTLDGGSLSTPDLDFNGGNFLFKSGTLTLGSGGHVFPPGNLTIGTDGPASMTLGSGTAVFGTLTLHGPDDSLSIPAGTTSLNALDNSRGGTLLFTGGTIALDGGQLTTAAGTIGGTVTGAGGLTKISDGSPTGGTLAISNGSLNYTGPTLISAGTLAIIGAAGFSDTTPVTIAQGATLDLSASNGEVFGSLAGAGTLIVSQVANAQTGANNSSTTFSGSITGPGNFVKLGTGFFALTGHNDHTGSTTVAAGQLHVHSGGSIDATSTLTLAAPATLTLGHPTLTPGSITTTTFNNTSGGTFNWLAGTLRIKDPNGITLGQESTPDKPFGNSYSLTPGRHLVIDHVTRVFAGASLSLAGGSLSTAQLDVSPGGTFSFTSGALTLTANATLTPTLLDRIDLARPLGPGRTLNLPGTATVSAPLTLAGGSLSAGTLLNPQNLILSSGTLTVASPLVIPAGASLNASAGMTIHALAGITLPPTAQFNAIGTTLTASAPSNSAGQLNAINSSLSFPAGLTSTGHLNLINSSLTGLLTSTSPASLTVAGTVTLHGTDPTNPDTAAILDSLSLGLGARLDLLNNSLIINHPADDNGATLAAILPLLQSAYTNGAWTGPGLTSSTAANDPTHLTTLAYLDSPASLIIAFTTVGDANLNGTLDPDDYALLDRSYASNLTDASWPQGDFNYDRVINDQDYLLLDAAYLHQLAGPPSPALLSLRQSQFGTNYVSSLLASIPEPSLALPSLLCPLYSLIFGRLHRRPRR